MSQLVVRFSKHWERKKQTSATCIYLNKRFYKLNLMLLNLHPKPIKLEYHHIFTVEFTLRTETISVNINIINMTKSYKQGLPRGATLGIQQGSVMGSFFFLI